MKWKSRLESWVSFVSSFVWAHVGLRPLQGRRKVGKYGGIHKYKVSQWNMICFYFCLNLGGGRLTPLYPRYWRSCQARVANKKCNFNVRSVDDLFELFTTQDCHPWGHPQILADQLTLSQPGGENYAHHITASTSRFSDLPTTMQFNCSTHLHNIKVGN